MLTERKCSRCQKPSHTGGSWCHNCHAAYQRAYRQVHKKACAIYSKAWREKWRHEDPEGYRAYEREHSRTWRVANLERAKTAKRTYAKRKWRTDARYRISQLILSRMRKSLRRNGVGGKRDAHWETLIGYTCDQLVSHLKKRLPPGYAWQDLLAGKLHMDHIIPIAAFNFRSPDDLDFKRCWALDNLQLLPAVANKRKGAKLSAPHQPGLAFGLAIDEGD